MDKKSQDFSDDEQKAVLRFHKKKELQEHWKTLMEEGNEQESDEIKDISLDAKKKSE